MTRVAFADRADDVLDVMIESSGGSVLRAPAVGAGGEYDDWVQWSRRDVRRLVGAGLIAADGLAADVLLTACQHGPRAGVFMSMNADELVSWWFAEGLRGLDVRAARRARAERTERPDADWQALQELADVERAEAARGLLLDLVSSPAPRWFHDWCGRTVHEPKLLALAELGAAEWMSAPVPVDNGAAWWSKLVAKFDARCGR